ncbi:M56 family metallopeptidase [Fodinibacter luteus]|uniref:M56 family metallopeptidase n=1 Tax=Fodinibacter luteus TaxID=552064 RepID=UPI0031EF8E1D
MIPFLLAGLAVLLAWVAPGLMARQKRFRRAPRASLVAWQAVSLGGILAALAAAPATLPLLLEGEDALERTELVAPAVLLSTAVLARVLYAGHDVGVRLRRVRADHRQLVDIIATHERDRVRILQHPTPTAYCIPGRQARVVLSQGVLDALPADQLEAVVAHEDAHLRARHDLLLEFFAVVHRAVPAPLRSDAALSEVRLLVEVLADRAAVRRSGEVATARALLALAGSRTPEAALGVGTTAPVRLRLLADGPPHPVLPAVAYTYAALAGTLPLVLLAAAWT